MFPEAARVFFHTSKYFVTWIPYSVACTLVNFSFHPPSAHSAVYKPPNGNINSTLRDLEKVFKIMGDEKLILAGDMNIDTSNSSNATKRYLEKLMEHNLFQKTGAFTRITAKTKSTLDHVVTNINDLKTLVSHFCIADHQAVVALSLIHI